MNPDFPHSKGQYRYIQFTTWEIQGRDPSAYDICGKVQQYRFTMADCKEEQELKLSSGREEQEKMKGKAREFCRIKPTASAEFGGKSSEGRLCTNSELLSKEQKLHIGLLLSRPSFCVAEI